MQRIPGVVFQPLVGGSYKPAKPRLLIVGQSHYYDRKTRKTPICSYTARAFGPAIKHGSRLVNNLVATCSGDWPDAEARKRFWKSVAFYDYIQEFVGNRPRKSHRYVLWARSHKAFAAVLSALKPDLVLVFGIANWKNITNLNGSKGEPLKAGPQRYGKRGIIRSAEAGQRWHSILSTRLLGLTSRHLLRLSRRRVLVCGRHDQKLRKRLL